MLQVGWTRCTRCAIFATFFTLRAEIEEYAEWLGLDLGLEQVPQCQ